ncbi:hypothetical protein HMPREF0663_11841 [Hoylesella oralis ATCC 33269]|uniref:Uncharacterized protein n=1 Tax=Hoylesella oralis ATCC 33269 TaxID=873533 RepID=E7RRP0_9BACT|nr:hypothetical protein HMPREF0663_11841 [Hoylesella oralis ATCC 33269]
MLIGTNVHEQIINNIGIGKIPMPIIVKSILKVYVRTYWV